MLTGFIHCFVLFTGHLYRLPFYDTNCSGTMHSSRMRTDHCSGRHYMSVPRRVGRPPPPPVGRQDASENITSCGR